MSLFTRANSHNQYSYSAVGGPSSAKRKASKVMGSNFFVDERYEILDTLGSGAYGVVVSARDKVSGRVVAIKKIEKAFEHSTFTKRTLRELKIMRLLSHENIIKIETIQLPQSKEDFNEIYVVTELMETDLSSLMMNR